MNFFKKNIDVFLISFVIISLFSLSLTFFYGTFTSTLTKNMNLPITGKCIIIDPGHGGPDGGSVNKDGLIEKEVTLSIAKYLKTYLEGAGAFVVMTREEDKDLADPETKGGLKRKVEDLTRRIQMTRDRDGDAFISIHLNALPSDKWSGAQTFFNPTKPENEELANLIQNEIVKKIENTNRVPLKKNDVYILKQSPIPTALVEVGFLTHPSEGKLLGTTAYQKKMANAIYYGIANFFIEKK